MPLFAALLLIGLPWSHHADHDADHAHVEQGHGGHGTVVIDQDQRLVSRTFDIPVAATPTLFLLAPSSAGCSAHWGTASRPPGSRDPPHQHQPRAPPHLTA